MIEILSQSALATVQDLGRFGALRWGVGTAGAMDRMALGLRQPAARQRGGRGGDRGPGLSLRGAVRRGPCAFALTGADCAATLDGVPLLPWSAASARAGQVLRLGLPAGRRAGGAPAPTSASPAESTCRSFSGRAARSCAARSAAWKAAR